MKNNRYEVIYLGNCWGIKDKSDGIRLGCLFGRKLDASRLSKSLNMKENIKSAKQKGEF